MLRSKQTTKQHHLSPIVGFQMETHNHIHVLNLYEVKYVKI